MDTWEYITVYIRLETRRSRLKKSYEWTVDVSDELTLTGMAPALDYFGKQGWELVNVVDEYRAGNTTTSQVEVYRAFFKRKVEKL